MNKTSNKKLKCLFNRLSYPFHSKTEIADDSCISSSSSTSTFSTNKRRNLKTKRLSQQSQQSQQSLDSTAVYMKIPPYSPTYCKSNEFPYSNFYVKLPDGRWMVKYRSGKRDFLGTDIIESYMI